jgi:hypothetical protein
VLCYRCMDTLALGLEPGFQAPSIGSFFFFLLFFFGPAAYLCVHTTVGNESERTKRAVRQECACVRACVPLVDACVAFCCVHNRIRACVLPGTPFHLRRIVAIRMNACPPTQFMHLVYPIISIGDGSGDGTDQMTALNMRIKIRGLTTEARADTL